MWRTGDDLEREFQRVVKLVKDFPTYGRYSLSDADRRKLNSLYKQATEGRCNTAPPPTGPFFYSPEGPEEWRAWNALGGMSKDEAKQKYLEVYYPIEKCHQVMNNFYR